MGRAEGLGALTARHLLWTGGWDSTYRLLELLCFHRVEVVPHYILDEERRSLVHELRVMARLRAALAGPSIARLHPTRFAAKAEISPDAEITAAFRRLRAQGHIGSQYHWLARYAAQLAGTPLELCLDSGPVGDHDLRQFAVEQGDGDDRWWAIDPDYGGDLGLFRVFRLPVLGLDKLTMRRRAGELGFAELLESTWFCHHPTRGGKPCGRCSPCRTAVESGLGDRVPAAAHARRIGANLLRALGAAGGRKTPIRGTDAPSPRVVP